MARTGHAASRLITQFKTVPQLLQNIRYPAGSQPLASAAVQACIQANERRILGQGRILIRKSGTEPLIRVMAECQDPGLLADVVQDIVAAVQKAAQNG
jgi:phosphoglucosamine mutase